MTKTRHCEECRHHDLIIRGYRDSTLICAKGHKPRFYEQRWPYDDDWGWKRKCNDFDEKENTK